MRITPKRLHHSKKKGLPRIKTYCASNLEKTQQFVSKLEETLVEKTPYDDNIHSKWSRRRDAVYNSAIAVYGKKERKNADWYKAHWEDMKPVTEMKTKVLLAYKAVPSPNTLEALITARKSAQQTACQCTYTYWLNR